MALLFTVKVFTAGVPYTHAQEADCQITNHLSMSQHGRFTFSSVCEYNTFSIPTVGCPHYYNYYKHTDNNTLMYISIVGCHEQLISYLFRKFDLKFKIWSPAKYSIPLEAEIHTKQYNYNHNKGYFKCHTD